MTTAPRLHSLLALAGILLVAIGGGGGYLAGSIWQIEEDLPVQTLHRSDRLAQLMRDAWQLRLAVEQRVVAGGAPLVAQQLVRSLDQLLSQLQRVEALEGLTAPERTRLRAHIDRAALAASPILGRGDAASPDDLAALQAQAQTITSVAYRLFRRGNHASLEELEAQRGELGRLKLSALLLWSVAGVAAAASALSALWLRRAERAAARTRQQLHDAIESIDEGFVLFGADDRLVMHNRRFVELYPDLEPTLRPGITLVELDAAYLDAAPDANMRARRESWVAARRDRRSDNAGKACELQTSDGRWLRLTDYRTSDGGLVSVEADVTAIKLREAALAESEARFRSLAESSPIGIYQVDGADRPIYVNPALCRMLGASRPEEIKARRLIDYLAPEHRDLAMRHRAQRDVGVTSSYEVDMIGCDGRRRHVLVTGTPLMQAERGLDGILVSVLDITARRRAEARLQHLAQHDVLSGLPNRALFAVRLERALEIAQAGGTSFAVLAIDLDHFKDINDSLGHAVGDALLREVARRLCAAVRSSDTVSRLSGDEFAILLQGPGEPEVVQTVAWNIVRSVREPVRLDGQALRTSVSIGIASYPADGYTADELMRHADLALYQAKAAGRNGWTRFEARMSEKMTRRRRLEAKLRRALEDEAFELLYQPQIDLSSGRVVGAEALVRWTDPEEGPVSPADFIPIAEASGLIVRLGEWVLEQACVQAEAWRRECLATIRMSVNLSSVQVKRNDLVDRVAAILALTGFNPDQLELEITESVLLDDTLRIRTTLQQLRALGVGLALDDFGTGFSSLGYLKSFPVDRIKIDRSFVADIGASAQDDALVKAVIALGHSLGMRVIAEGIEHENQVEFLRAHGCDHAQGFHLGRPMPAASFAGLLPHQGRAPARHAAAAGLTAA